MQHGKLFATIVAGVFTFAGGGSGDALAQDPARPPEGTRPMTPTRISIGQAITTAEQQIGGRAVEADIKNQGSTRVFEVDIVKDNQTHLVFIDAQSGQVIRTELSGTMDAGRRADSDWGRREDEDEDDDDD